jgi:ectoine hydroxylase-related dioxygenase (phytanoyl-CoA dioxygenase family)
MRTREFTDSELASLAADLERDGICILKGLFDREGIAAWAAAFDELVERRRSVPGALAPRGPGRVDVTLPWTAPFADPAVFAAPPLMKLFERVFAQEYALVQLAVDTPVLGSDYQELHRDHRPLFSEDFHTPAYALAANFALCDVSEANGPLQMVRGSHRMRKADALERLARGELEVESFPMAAGDLALRWPYALHRGSPNRTDRPRPMVVMGYVMHWLRTVKVDLDVPRDVYDSLEPRIQAMLRCRVVESLPQEKAEAYVEFEY